MKSITELNGCIERLLKDQGIREAPIPVERIAASLGATIRRSPLDQSLSGMIYLKGSKPIIGVNSRHHPNRQRFTIAHETAHLVLHKSAIFDHVHVDRRFPVLMRDANSAIGIEQIEIEANRFAAELLMPTFLLMPELKIRGFDIDDEQPLARLAQHFRVSTQALQYRIGNSAW